MHAQGSAASLLTQMKKKSKNVSIFLKGDDEQDDDDDEEEKNKVEEVLGRGARHVLATKTRVSHRLSDSDVITMFDWLRSEPCVWEVRDVDICFFLSRGNIILNIFHVTLV